ncbi:MAG: hypothetical protein RJA70_2807 [Pseudomonadota bacterium]|jgi:hypothetical protein
MISAIRPVLAPLCLLLAACGPPAPPKEVPIDQLPPYSAEEQAVFDDSLAPEVFGLATDHRAFLVQPNFRARSEQADLVFRAKLVTVRQDLVAGQATYVVVFQRIGAPLVGGYAPSELEVTVGRGSPSLSSLRSMAGKAVGSRTTVLLRRYRKDDERVAHFRAEPDSEQVRKAILDARREARARATSPEED